MTFALVAMGGLSILPEIQSTNCDPDSHSSNSTSIVSETKLFQGFPVSCSGTLHALNGCQFEISNFLVANIPKSCEWWGSNSNSPTSFGFQVVQGVISSTNSTIVKSPTFNLNANFSFSDFSFLKLFCPNEKLVIGTFQTSEIEFSSPLGTPSSSLDSDKEKLDSKNNLDLEEKSGEREKPGNSLVAVFVLLVSMTLLF